MSLTISDNQKILLAFLLSTLLLITLPILSPLFRLTFYAPLLIIVYYKKSFISSLWIALICGIIMDLLTTPSAIGTYAFNYCLTTAILYSQKRNFFEDSYSTLPVMTFLFVIISTVTLILSMEIFGKSIPLSFSWALSDLFLMPLVDAFYAFVCFFYFMPRASQREYFF